MTRLRTDHRAIGAAGAAAMAGLLPRSETPIVPKRLDRRPRAGGGRRDHDVPRLADHRRGHAGARRRRRLAVRGRARGHDPGAARGRAATSRPRSRRAVEIARAFPGVAEVRAYSKEESARLLEPWLGSRARARRSAGAAHDRGAARARRGARSRAAAQGCWPSASPARASTIIAPGSTACARWRSTTIVGGIGVLLLMLAATVLSVMFATRGAMAANRPIVEVLHFIGAKSGFIAGQFQRHFLMLGLKGGLIGGGAGDAAVRARRRSPANGRSARPAASSSPRCSAPFARHRAAMSRSSRRSC